MNTNTKNGISDETKKSISVDLRYYVQNVAGSANRASNMLDGVSVATVSNMLNGKWAAISDDMWRKVQKQVSTSYSGEWNVVQDTTNFKELMTTFEDARKYAKVFGIIGDPGFGKTEAARVDSLNNENSFHISCNEYDTKKSFLLKLLSKMGKEPEGFTVPIMMATAIEHINRMDHPLIKLDEADKLSDPVFHFFITLYNELNGKCGLVLTATPFLKKRIIKGVERDKRGYKEIYSRIGGRFVTLRPPTEKDIEKIVRANGVFDEMEVRRIVNDCRPESSNLNITLPPDLRRVNRLVFAYKQELKQMEVA